MGFERSKNNLNYFGKSLDKVQKKVYNEDVKLKKQKTEVKENENDKRNHQNRI